MRLRIAAQNKPGRPGRNPLRDHFHGRPCSPRGSVVDRILPWWRVWKWPISNLNVSAEWPWDLPHGFPWIWEGLVKEDPFLIFFNIYSGKATVPWKTWLPALGRWESYRLLRSRTPKSSVAKWRERSSIPMGISSSCMVLLQFLWHSFFFKLEMIWYTQFLVDRYFFLSGINFPKHGFRSLLKKTGPNYPWFFLLSNDDKPI